MLYTSTRITEMKKKNENEKTLLPPDSSRHINYLLHPRDIMNSNHIRSTSNTRRHRTRSAPSPLLRNLHAGNLSDKPLPTRPHNPRQTNPTRNLRKTPEQFQVLLQILSESESRVEQYIPPTHAGFLSGANAVLELGDHAGDHAGGVGL